MAIKVVLDGTLFSECEMQGANRDGMMRLTEDITDRLVLNSELEINFANTLYIEKYDKLLKKFVKDHYPQNYNNIISKRTPFLTNLLKWKGLYRTKLAKLPISPYYKEIDACDIFHSFYYPFSSSISKNKINRSITFLDIIPLKRAGYPEVLVKRTKDVVDSVVSNFGISISEYSKQDLLNYDKRAKQENIFVAPLAASKELFYQNKNESDWELVKNKYQLPDNYFLCVAGNDKRKNIAHIIKCFSEFFLQEKPQDLYLVLTGNCTHNRTMLDELEIPKMVCDRIYTPLTFIDSKDLAVLYSNAMAFFFMSLYEGFGLPALEAMQCGVPVVASNTTSLPEVVGEGGIQLPPDNVDELCNVMSVLYKDETIRKKYEIAGLKRADTFSWQRCADEYANIFKTITTNFS